MIEKFFNFQNNFFLPDFCRVKVKSQYLKLPKLSWVRKSLKKKTIKWYFNVPKFICGSRSTNNLLLKFYILYDYEFALNYQSC